MGGEKGLVVRRDGWGEEMGGEKGWWVEWMGEEKGWVEYVD